MTRLVVEIDRQQDVELLLALIRRLDLRVVEPLTQSEPEKPGPSDELRSFILQGLPEKQDLNAFILDFEVSKKDRVLPGREG